MGSRIKYEDVKAAVSFNGWKLISDTYVNLNTEMEFECPEGHLVQTTWKKWRTNPICPTCESNKTIGAVEIISKSKGIIRVLAIDDATQISGWSIFDNQKLVAYGKFELPQKDPIERISKMRQWFMNMISNWKPDVIGLEDIQLQTFAGKYGNQEMAVTTYKTLAHLQGALLVTAYEMGIETTLIHVSSWRAHCKITAKSRTDQKRAAQLFVQNNYNKIVTQDEADAICIGKYLSEKHVKNFEMIDFNLLGG